MWRVLQAQHHMKQQQVYVGSVAVNHSIEGPIPDPVALPAGRVASQTAGNPVMAPSTELAF